MSFIFDIPALVVLGYILGRRLSSSMPFEDKSKNEALAATLLASVFLVVAVPMYLDLVNVPWIGRAGFGRNFMWNSGLEFIGIGPLVDVSPTYVNTFHPMNMVASLLFLCYPISSWLGLQMGKRRFG